MARNGLDLLAEVVAAQMEEVTREIEMLEASIRARPPVPAPRRQRSAGVVQDSPPLPRMTSSHRPTPKPRLSLLSMKSPPMAKPSPRFITPKPVHSSTPVGIKTELNLPDPSTTASVETESELQHTSTPASATTKWLPKSFSLNPHAPVFTPLDILSNNHQDLSSLQITRQLKKPTIEVTKFSGDPTRYAQFCRQFNVRIVSNCDNYDECMSYLLQFTSGEAHDVAQGFAHLDAQLGFNAAIQEFKRRYGDPTYVAQAYITKALEWEVIKPDDPAALDRYGIFLCECLYAIQEMNGIGILEYSENLRKLVGKLPVRLHDKWRSVAFRARERGESVTFSALVDFVQTEARKVVDPVYGRSALQLTKATDSNSAKPVPKPRNKIPINSSGGDKVRTLMNTGAASPVIKAPSSNKCPLCGDNHLLFKCKRFMDMATTEERRLFVKTQKLCFNCLRQSHVAKDCKSSVRCRVQGCGTNHHTLLHQLKGPAPHNATVQGSVLKTGYANDRELKTNYPPFFQLLPVYIYKNGRSIPTVAMLDSASQLTIIHQSLARDLGLKGRRGELTINTMNSTAVMDSQVVSFSIRPRDSGNNACMHINGAYSLNVRNFQCTTQKCNPEWDHCRGLNIPAVIEPGDVQLLIGLDNPEAHVQLEVRRGSPDQPLAIRTTLGWSLMGGDGSRQSVSEPPSVNRIVLEESNRDLEEFWSTEAFGVSSSCAKPTSAEDVRAQKLLEENTVLRDGYYEVGMLWRDPHSTLPNNIAVARRRFDLLMKRFNQDPEYMRLYQETVNNYVAQGYARLMTAEEAAACTPRTWYLPHHGVVNPNKPGKVRVVYDAASSYQGHSLNGALMTGPDYLNSLLGVLQRFRLHAVGLVTDIKSMYHQVRVSKSDADSLRFLHKEELSQPGPPQTYQMMSHVFGATDSPSCAMYALQRTARDNASEFSQEAVDTILQDTYMDDVVKSLDDVPSTIRVALEVDALLAKGGFTTHHWLSNNRDVMEALHSLDFITQDVRFDHDEHVLQRTLGVRWDIQDDNFTFVSQVKDNPMTKRGLVSTMSSIFDPCGFITPFTLRAKLLAQELWKSGIGWDDALTPEVAKSWQSWMRELNELPGFKLPRHHSNFSTQANTIELHTFTDASENAFAAATYLRFATKYGYAASLLASKSRVAPLKALSIPRLELQGALLGARLAKTIETELRVPITRRVFWTDSEIVLKYLQNPARRFKPFVANRVAEICELSDVSEWRHVPTRANPADCCTRGLPIADLIGNNLWLQGPAFLADSPQDWPGAKSGGGVGPELEPHDPEVRRTVLNLGMEDDSTIDEEVNMQSFQYDVSQLISADRFSVMSRLVRRTAWIQRAVCNLASSIPRLKRVACKEPDITASEYEQASMLWVRVAQRDVYSKEIKLLEKGQSLGCKSDLFSLMPFFDSKLKCLRVGGRLGKAPVPGESKHQIILPADHHITRLIADQVHKKLSHGGQEHIIAEMRQSYWPVKARRVAKQAIRRCFFCYLQKVKPRIPRMANLPLCRLDVTSGVFRHVGVDYWGPMLVKVRRSTIKKWGCLFTCLVTRAVHLELADSLATDDFLLCLRAFIGRRGHPKDLFSDNGTNFRGAEAELAKCLQELDQTKIYGLLSPHQIVWHFNPPSAPHFGGAWERLVGSVKRALNATLKNTLVGESALRIALIEVEAILNSRPLTHNSPDPEDLQPITPNHFILGRADNKVPPTSCEDKEINSKKRWRQCQVIANQVCRRWQREYLPTLTARDKWTKDNQSTVIGSLVIVVDENQPRGHWELGRVTALYPGEDGRVRAVDVKTASTTLRRPVAKICVLEENVNRVSGP